MDATLREIENRLSKSDLPEVMDLMRWVRGQLGIHGIKQDSPLHTANSVAPLGMVSSCVNVPRDYHFEVLGFSLIVVKPLTSFEMSPIIVREGITGHLLFEGPAKLLYRFNEEEPANPVFLLHKQTIISCAGSVYVEVHNYSERNVNFRFVVHGIQHKFTSLLNYIENGPLV